MRAPARAAVLLALAAVIAGCASEDPNPQPSVTPTVTATEEVTTAATPSAPPTTSTPPPEPVTLTFVGDINFEREIRDRLDADPGTVFGPARDLLGRADLTFGNL